ncbi:uncharacterized protein LOC111148452 [Enhydra lutris kenyoni]|uniref:Uncharacterized protein LOC111148452 n=1 Tax=Enhydra lutris kenyoni TaxID=391180 RepID=A0A2Y9JJD1_ENHLU|nr:uncharacterized protein LOC111148452 [Enhydra lutris kenyoni]
MTHSTCSLWSWRSEQSRAKSPQGNRSFEFRKATFARRRQLYLQIAASVAPLGETSLHQAVRTSYPLTLPSHHPNLMLSGTFLSVLCAFRVYCLSLECPLQGAVVDVLGRSMGFPAPRTRPGRDAVDLLLC